MSTGIVCSLVVSKCEWLKEFVKAAGGNVSWTVLKGGISTRYGVPKEWLRFRKIREFQTCNKSEQETLDNFLDRFKRLRAKSGIRDKLVIAMMFFDAFPDATACLIMMTMAQAEESCFYDDIDYVSAIARRVDIANRDKVGHTAASAGARKRISNNPVSAEAKKSKFGKEPSVPLNNDGVKQTPWVSRFGKTLKQHIAKRTCKNCDQHYAEGHNCHTAIRTPSKALRSMTMRPPNREVDAMVAAARASEEADRVLLGRKGVTSVSVPVPVAVATNDSFETNAGVNASADSDIVMLELGGDSTDDEFDLWGRDHQSTLVNSLAKVSVTDDELMINLSAQQCKFDIVFSAKPAMQSKSSICVPLLVQNVVCFGLVDTDATFSCITNEIFTYLGGTNLSGFEVAEDRSVVQLAHEVSTVPRLGSVALSLEYNRINTSHLFEVFSSYSNENVHVLLGMDILSKLGIDISGLVTRHGFQSGPKLPDPIDDSIKLNADPFGSDSERAPYLKLLKGLLVENAQIDMKNT